MDTLDSLKKKRRHEDELLLRDQSSEASLLKEIWAELNVGHNGYLSVSELKHVCLYIGMTEMSQQVHV